MLRLFAVCLALAGGVSNAVKPVNEMYGWKEMTFAWPDEATKENAIKAGEYIPENNLPLGVDRYQDKLFLTVPRWKAGVAASLGYVDLKNQDPSPPLVPYPDWKANTLPKDGEQPDDNHITSVFRVRVEHNCDRLWVMDTGLADILGSPRQIGKPAIVVFDLKTDKLIRRYPLKTSDLKEDSFFANIIVDSVDGKCDEAFAYIPDLGGYGVVVYSWADNDSWRVKHNYFHFDPLKGDLNVDGINFQWTDGVFGLALGTPAPSGYRTMYFHPLASTHEFSVSTQILRNKTLAQDPHSYHMYKIEGEKGDDSQTTASDFDEKNNVLFMTQLNRDGFACWNPRRPLNPENVALLAQDHEKLIFTNDLKLDTERNLWVLSDKMPTFLFKGLDPNVINYRVFKVNADDIIKGTPCEA